MLDEKTDYCCENNRLIAEVDYEKPKELEQAYVALQNGSITLMEYMKILNNMV